MRMFTFGSSSGVNARRFFRKKPDCTSMLIVSPRSLRLQGREGLKLRSRRRLVGGAVEDRLGEEASNEVCLSARRRVAGPNDAALYGLGRLLLLDFESTVLLLTLLPMEPLGCELGVLEELRPLSRFGLFLLIFPSWTPEDRSEAIDLTDWELFDRACELAVLPDELDQRFSAPI